MKIGMPVYQGVDLLDVAGPHEMFGWMNQPETPVEIILTAEQAGEVTTRRTDVSCAGFVRRGQLVRRAVSPRRRSRRAGSPDVGKAPAVSRFSCEAERDGAVRGIRLRGCITACRRWSLGRLPGHDPSGVYSLFEAVFENKGRKKASALRSRRQPHYRRRDFVRPCRSTSADQEAGWL